MALVNEIRVPGSPGRPVLSAISARYPVTDTNVSVSTAAFTLTTYQASVTAPGSFALTAAEILGTADAVISLAINAGGSGYAAGDLLTVSGGTGTAAKISVLAVSSGAVTEAYVHSYGDYSALPSNPVSVTGGSGSSATFNLTTGSIGHKLKLTFNDTIQDGSGTATVKASKLVTTNTNRPIPTVGAPTISTNTATYTLRSGKPIYSGETITVDIPSGLIERASDSAAIGASSANAVTNNSDYDYEFFCRILSLPYEMVSGTYTLEAEAVSHFGISSVVMELDDGVTTLTGSAASRDISTIGLYAPYVTDFDMSLLNDGEITATCTATDAATGATYVDTKTIYNNDGASITIPDYYYGPSSGNDSTGAGTLGNPYATAGKCTEVARLASDATCRVILMEDADVNLQNGYSGNQYNPTYPVTYTRNTGTTTLAGSRIVDDGATTIRNGLTGLPCHIDNMTIFVENSVNDENISKVNFPFVLNNFVVTHGQSSPATPNGVPDWVSGGTIKYAHNGTVDKSLKSFPYFAGVRNCISTDCRSDFGVNITEYAVDCWISNRGKGRPAFTVQYTGGGTGTVSSSGYSPSQVLNLHVNGSIVHSVTITGGSSGMLVSDMVSAINSYGTGWSATTLDNTEKLSQERFAFFGQVNCDSALTIYNGNSDHSDLFQWHSGNYKNVLISSIRTKTINLAVDNPGTSTDLQNFWIDNYLLRSQGIAFINVSDPTFQTSGINRTGMHGHEENNLILFCDMPYTNFSLINGSGMVGFVPQNTFFGATVIRDLEIEGSADYQGVWFANIHTADSPTNLVSGDVIENLSNGAVAGLFSDEAYDAYTLNPESASVLEDGAYSFDDISDAYGRRRDSGATAIGAFRGPAETASYPSETTDVNVSAATEALTLTTYPATITAVSDTNIAAATEALTLTTYAATITAPGASATNLMPSGSTNAFDTYPPWTNAGTAPTVTADTTANPLGSGTNADTIEDTNSGSQSGRGADATVTSDTNDYLGSVYVKAGTSSSVMFMVGNNTVVFDLTGGGSIGHNPNGWTAAISDEGGGWFRISVSKTNTSSSTMNFRVYPACADIYDATATGSAIFCNAMLEQKSGSTPSTYVDP